MGWHSDDERELGDNPTIASLSLGATREFQMRHKKYRVNGLSVERFQLRSGSLVIMRGNTQTHWQHCVPKRSKRKPCGARLNLTFRNIL